MSDASSAQHAMNAALVRCTGGPGCPCGCASSPRSSLPSSPSRSRSTNVGGSGNGGASSQSEGHSDSSLPGAVPEHELSGLGVVRVRTCQHGRHAVLKKCWGGKNTGRRFLACHLEDEDERCNFLEWLDEPWPERVQAALKKLWRELKLTKHIEAEAHDHLIDALKLNETAAKEKEKLKADAERTKRIAEEVCTRYQRRAAYATVDKSKLMYLVYCLLGVIALQLALIFAILYK